MELFTAFGCYTPLSPNIAIPLDPPRVEKIMKENPDHPPIVRRRDDADWSGLALSLPLIQPESSSDSGRRGA